MVKLEEKFSKMGIDNAPGQEINQTAAELPLRGEALEGTYVDFSHGDVDAFAPTPGAIEAFSEGFLKGGKQAYTEYAGRYDLRAELAGRLSAFTRTQISAENVILTPGTQGALFLAMGACIGEGTKVAIIEPDYFANRKLVYFLGGELIPVRMDYFGAEERNEAGIDLSQLESALKQGARVILYSNPNNPTGVIYSEREVRAIAELAAQYGATVIADQLYSRQIFDNRPYTHYCALTQQPENCITIIGPSKTESLSGFRLGAAFGSRAIISRMEKLQAIVTLRCGGYNQAVFKTWFAEPEGFMQTRIAQHQAIRDELVEIVRSVDGVKVRSTEGGSYLFVRLPKMAVSMSTFVKILRKQGNVVVTPGTEFGPQFTDSFRINFSQDRYAAADAVRRITKLIERYRYE